MNSWLRIIRNDDGTPLLGEPWAGPALLLVVVVVWAPALFF